MVGAAAMDGVMEVWGGGAQAGVGGVSAGDAAVMDGAPVAGEVGIAANMKWRTRQLVRRSSNMRAAVDRCPPVFVNQISCMQLSPMNWRSTFVC